MYTGSAQGIGKLGPFTRGGIYKTVTYIYYELNYFRGRQNLIYGIVCKLISKLVIMFKIMLKHLKKKITKK